MVMEGLPIQDWSNTIISYHNATIPYELFHLVFNINTNFKIIENYEYGENDNRRTHWHMVGLPK